MRRFQFTRYPGNGIDLFFGAEEAQLAIRGDQIERLGPSVNFCDFLVEILLIAHFEIIHRLSCRFLIREVIVEVTAWFVIV